MKIAYSIVRRDRSRGEWSIDTEQMVWKKTPKFDDNGMKCGEMGSYFMGATGIEQISKDFHDGYRLEEATGSWLEVMREMEDKRDEIKSKLAELNAELNTGSEDYLRKLTQLTETIVLTDKGELPTGLQEHWAGAPLKDIQERAKYEIDRLQKMYKSNTLKRISEQQKLLKRIELCIRAWNKGAIRW